MKLSIITINLNNREGLQRTIDSVVSQTFHDFEWIVIDGGSTDGSRELIEKHAEHFAYWVSEPDKGIYNAMNKGIRITNGEYIQFLNSGDWYCEKNSLSNVFSVNPTANIIFANCNLVKEGIIVESRYYPDIMSLKEIIDLNICHNSTFFKRELFANNKYSEDLSIASDLKFLLQRILENCSMEHVPTSLINYDLGGFSSTHPDFFYIEKAEIIREIISPSIQKDLQNINYLSDHQKDAVLEKVDYYRNSNVFFHKLITAILLLMKWFSKAEKL